MRCAVNTKTQSELQRIQDAVIVLRALQKYCSPYTTGVRPSDRSIVEAVDVVVDALNETPSSDTATSDR